MTQTGPTAAPAPQGGAALGVMEATRMGWRLLMSDFWPLWTVALVEMIVIIGASMFGMVACLVVVPPLVAGLFYVVARRIDGGPAEVGDLFAGFQKRFGQSVVGFLPVTIASAVFGMVLGAVISIAVIICMAVAQEGRGDEEVIIPTVIIGILAVLAVWTILFIAVKIFVLFFTFVLPAVWDHPESGWAAAKDSMRLVRQHFLSVVGLVLLFMVIGLAAQLVGMAVCCVGTIFTGPLVVVWQTATTVYLYRSWSGRPLVQAAASGAAGAGR
jgi:hypothetical protein